MKYDARARKGLIYFGAAALLALGAATAQVAMAAGTGTGIDNTGNYQHEVQSCLNGNTQQARATCLKEARNAHADKVRGVLMAGVNSRDLNSNALARCDVFKNSDDKAACAARVENGAVEGSVASGGILREATETSTAMGNR